MEFPYLAATEVIDHHTPAVRRLAVELAGECAYPLAVARRCFEWVRDTIEHSSDFKRNPVTCTASEVPAGTGYCYAKSHLLAALLRANRIPAGFCYQRLTIHGAGPPFCLHGLNAVLLPGVDWYRVDARGNRADVHAEFDPPDEQLAFAVQFAGEYNFQGIYAEPWPEVVHALRSHATWDALLANLPDRSEFE